MSNRSSPDTKRLSGHGTWSAPEGARDELRGKVQALKRPETYPGAVSEIEAIETHMSWVFLTDEHAYKLKKPVRTSLLDQTTLEKRRQACRRELRLNRRLAEDVYLGVVSLVATGGEMRLEGEGEPIDWLVKMRRLSKERILESQIEDGTASPQEIDRLAERLATFYETTDAAPMGKASYRERLTDDIAAKAETLRQPRYGLAPEALTPVVSPLEGRLDEDRRLVESRASAVVDAHGDLRPEHICLEDPPVVIDCLEFERSLRLLDPVSELSFLALECRRLGAGWIGERLIDGYVDVTGDTVLDSLVAFYQGYHALVRATIAVWHIDDEALDRPEHWRRKARRYLRLGGEAL